MGIGSKLKASFSKFFVRAKVKYSEETEDPNSKLSAVKRTITQLNDEITKDAIVSNIEEGASNLMVSIGIDEPLKETEYGMVNPYRKGLDQFLAQEEERKKKEQEEAEEARERERQEAMKRAEELVRQAEEQAANSSTIETDGGQEPPKENKEEFKFTIDGDDEEDEEVAEAERADPVAVESELVKEEFVDSDEDEAKLNEGTAVAAKEDEAKS